MAKTGNNDKEIAKSIGGLALFVFCLICGGLTWLGIPPPWSLIVAGIVVILLFGWGSSKSRKYDGQVK